MIDFFSNNPVGTLKALHDYQQTGNINILEALRANPSERIIAVAATGAGKTVMFCHLIDAWRRAGLKVGVLVFDKTLVNQTVTRLFENGITNVGVIQADNPAFDWDAPVQVISVMTMAKRRKRWPADVYVVDEAHRNNDYLFRLMREIPHVPFVGFTATPATKGLGRHYKKLIQIASMRELIERGFLADFTVYAPAQKQIEKAVAGVAVKAGEFVQDQLADAVDKAEIVGDIFAHWLRLAAYLQTLIFAVNRKHAKHICQVFREAGIAVEYLDGDTRDLDRAAILRRFERKEVQVIVNIGVLTTGFDSYVEAVVDAHPTKSVILYIQTWGRALRKKPDGRKAIFIDHSGNCLRLGLPTDIEFEELDDGRVGKAGERKKKERKEPLPRLCEECSAVIQRDADKCPQCGWVKPAHTSVIHKPGNLAIYGSEGIGGASWAEKYEFASELFWIVRERGYKTAWAKFKIEERFGIKIGWDHALMKARPKEPTLTTRNWVRSRAIAFAKAREKGVANG
ncbi:MAG: DEAD/DEAH box helicase [Methylocystis sp.]|uniref:DEAD/DEAH box helicase n=1 Tax=Methylocystis sp. TaxID=1911079 RepID=UPI003DA57EE9